MTAEALARHLSAVGDKAVKIERVHVAIDAGAPLGIGQVINRVGLLNFTRLG